MIGLIWSAAGCGLVGILVAGLRGTLRLGLWIQIAALLVVAAVAAALLADSASIGSSFVNGIHPSLGIDPLSAFFLLVIAVTAVPVLVYATSYLIAEPRRGALGALTGAFLMAMCLVVVARDISTFLAGWELMTLIPAVAILVYRRNPEVRRAVFVYLSITHLGGVGVWLALILLSAVGALADPAIFGQQGAALQWTIWIGAIIGFGVKAGLMPMHTWLPRAHPVAPSHLSALMSGVMLKIAIYGLIRVLFFWTGPVPVAIAVIVLVLGALSALGGILYAIFAQEIKRLLAFSSIENVGIITVGLAAALLLAHAHQEVWASIAFAAALLHTLNHAVFKSLLFLGSGAVQRATRLLDIDHLGGLLRRMPWTAGFFILGAAAIAGIPGLNGFVSEWLTLQSLIHMSLDGSSVPWSGPLAAAALAATAAMAVLCFVKVVGLVFLGRARSAQAEEAREVSWPMRVGQGLLALMCVGLGLFAALLLPVLANLRGVPVELPTGLSLALPQTGGLPMPAIALALCAAVAVLIYLRGRRPTAVTAATWNCGQVQDSTLAWTSSAFTKPLRLSWAAFLRSDRRVRVDGGVGVVTSAQYQGDVPNLFDTKVYSPVEAVLTESFSRARRLQSGRLRNYAIYLLLLLAALLLLARLGVGV
ncbi:MAG: proton-conducting transporter membrane subunit [Actinomycetes bacterium]